MNLSKLPQEQQDLINRWRHQSELYLQLKEDKSFYLKIELPDIKVSQVVTGDVEDLITGSTLDSFRNLIINLKDQLETKEMIIQKHEEFQNILKLEITTLENSLVKTQKENTRLISRNFFQRLFNK
jgi:hypothetical protein